MIETYYKLCDNDFVVRYVFRDKLLDGVDCFDEYGEQLGTIVVCPSIGELGRYNLQY